MSFGCSGDFDPGMFLPFTKKTFENISTDDDYYYYYYYYYYVQKTHRVYSEMYMAGGLGLGIFPDTHKINTKQNRTQKN